MVGHRSFVGRDAELGELSRLLDRARDHVPGFVVIQGPAGIGKTALVGRFLDGADDARILRASGEESEADLAFGVLDQLVHGSGRPPPDAAAERCDQGDEPHEVDKTDPLTSGARFLEVLSELERPGPVIVAVDDAHWADSLSLLALTFAIRRLSKDRVLVVVTLRDADDVALPGGFRRLLTGELAHRLLLSGLGSGDLRRLSADLVGEALSPRAAARLRDHTAGNPLHARALLEQLPVTAFQSAQAPLPAPRSVGLLVVGRLAACDDETRQFVAAASVLGRRCTLHLAADVAAVDDPLLALDEATEAGLLVEDPPSRMVAFPHPLLCAAVYQHLGAAERTRLHRRAAEAVDDERMRLRHRVRAATGPDLALARKLAAFARRQTQSDRSACGEYLAAAAELAPGTPEGEQCAAEAIDCQLMTGDVGDLAGRAAQLRTFRATAWRNYVLARLALVAGRLEEAESLLHDAWRRCESDTDPSPAARIAGELAWIYVARDRGHDAVIWNERALDLAGEHGTTDLSHMIHLVSLNMTGRIGEHLTALSGLPDAAVASVTELDALLGRALLHTWSEDLDAAYRDATGLLAAAGRSITFELTASIVLGRVEYLLGRWDDAVAHTGLTVSLAVDADHGWLAPICHALASLVPSARGQWEQASDHVETAARIVHPGHVIATSWIASARAHLAAARNDHTAVIDALRPLLDRGPESAVFDPGALIRWQDLLTDALAAEGQHGEAEAVLKPFEARAAADQRHSAIVAAARARGTLLSARHEFDDALAAFERGLDHVKRVDMPFDRARLDLAAGSCLRRAGRRNAAAAHLRQASTAFACLAAGPYLERSDRELAACGARHTTPAHSTQPALTPQELAVARLVTHGMTNKQIARELVISSKTVEYHLSHIYAKLQVSSRVQLARRLAED